MEKPKLWYYFMKHDAMDHCIYTVPVYCYCFQPKGLGPANKKGTRSCDQSYEQLSRIGDFFII